MRASNPVSRCPDHGADARPGMTARVLRYFRGSREKRQAARPGDVGAGLVVAGALVAMEAVLRAGIDEDLDIRPLRLDGLDIGQRNAGILLAEMQLRRHLRLLVGKAHDGAAVIADRGLQARSAASRRQRRCCRRGRSRRCRPGRRSSPHRSRPGCRAASRPNRDWRRICALQRSHRAYSRTGSPARCDRRSTARSRHSLRLRAGRRPSGCDD